MNNKNIGYFLQCREVFHLEFLRRFGRKIKPENYCLKGGVNLRFFFHSCRYSEDMDLDVCGVRVDVLKEIVMGILGARSFQEILGSFGIEKVGPPDMSKAKQTETTQRFKIHLFALSGEDLVTKIEFSRRGMKKRAKVESVSDSILRAYKMPPLLVPHYTMDAAIAQKIQALCLRSTIQARDVFDLYLLSSQYAGPASVFNPLAGIPRAAPVDVKSRWDNVPIRDEWRIGTSPHGLSEGQPGGRIKKGPRACPWGSRKEPDSDSPAKARDNVFKISFEHFRDAVISYLAPHDQAVYGTPQAWDEVRLKTARFIEELEKRHV